MKAIAWEFTPFRYVIGKALGGVTGSAVYGRLSGLRKRDLPLPTLPGPEWVRLRVESCGICGTDIGSLNLASSTALEPFASFPAVLGHEILARVEEVGPEVTRVRPGDRVVVDPLVSCQVRGYARESWCGSCANGLPATCARQGDEGVTQVDGRALAPGMTMGYHRDLPGGWGERTIVHQSQLFRVSEELDDRTAVLAEPLSIALHAVLASRPPEGGPVLVIGSGTVALATIWALRATGYTGPLFAQAKRPHEQKLARELGASQVIAPGEQAREALMGTGTRAYKPSIGNEVYAGGGFPLIFDCVGRPGSFTQALQYASPRGRVVMLGCAGSMPRLDLTWIWAREIEVRGFVGYGTERWRGERLHTFEIALRLMEESAAPLHKIVTHAFPLDQYRDALNAADDHRISGAIKVVLKP